MKAWIRSFRCTEGFQTTALDAIKSNISEQKVQNNNYQVAVLSYDEMKVRETIEYDSRERQIVGPHKHVQVLMLRGLFQSWKKLVFFKFDQQVTADLLLHAITHLQEETGVEIVSVVHDLCRSNTAAWKDLKVDTRTPFFTNPSFPNLN